MDYLQQGARLDIRLKRDFNLLTTRKIARLAEDADTICIDLTRSRIVDSEAVMLLYRLVRAGKQISLKSPPPILDEIIHILGLESILDLKELAE